MTNTSAGFVPWRLLTVPGHTDCYSDCLHTHTHTHTRIKSKGSLQFAPDSINVVYRSALHMSCLSSCPQQAHTHTQRELYTLYHPRRPSEGMPPMWHMPTAQRLEGCLNSLYEPTPVQICCQRLQIQSREWVSEGLRRTGGSEWGSKEKDWSTSSATTPKYCWG